MARIVLVRRDDGQLYGVTPADERAYERFNDHVEYMEPGDTIAFSWTEPRSPEFHRAHFALIRLLFDSQQVFTSPETLRAWLTVGAGHADVVPGPTGEIVAVPRSISYESLDDVEFRQFHARVLDFLRTPAAYGYLWPNVNIQRAAHALDTMLLAYERGDTNAAPDDPGKQDRGEPID